MSKEREAPAHSALKLAKELDGVIADVEEGMGFDDVCLGTIKYVRDVLMSVPDGAEPPCKTGSQCTSKCQQCEQPAEQQEPEYAWPTVADYERDVGYQINEAFRIGWNMARTTNKMLGHSSSQPAPVAEPHKQQEPVAVMTVLHLKDRTEIGYGPASAGYDLPTGEYKLYTSPPVSKRLTDEQIMEMYNEPRSDAEMLEFARAIEAAHGIKGDA